LGRLDLDNPHSWDEIRLKLAIRTGTDFRSLMKRPLGQRPPEEDGGEA
jgi:hypothetical protein